MDLIASIPLIGGFLSVVLPFLVVISIVVFIHEYGHYIVGRWCGIHAETFSLGFGRVLTSWTDKRGTRWQIAALPLGGYVKFLGDADPSSRTDDAALAAMSEHDRSRSFPGAAIWKRMLTVVAGPVANFILSAVVFAGLAMWSGLVITPPTFGEIDRAQLGEEVDLQPGDVLVQVNGQTVERFSDLQRIAQAMKPPGPLTLVVSREDDTHEVKVPFPIVPVVEGVEPLSPASRAGLQVGDLIVAADGETLTTFGDLRDAVLPSIGKTLILGVRRNGEILSMPIRPQERVAEDGQGGFEKRVMIGVSGGSGYFFSPETATPMPWTALWIGVQRIEAVISGSLRAIKEIITGGLEAKNLQGPVGIASVSGHFADQGLMEFITLIAVISTAIGMLNLFPIPVLDGGHLVIFTYEAITGRPPAPMALQIAMSVGLSLVLLLMVFATYNDVMRLISVS